PSCLASFEVAAIVGRCLPGDPMKGSAERARAMESDIECNLSDRCAGVCQQGLGALNPPARPVAIRRLPEGLLEGSQKMIWAQPHQIGEHAERNGLGKMLLDEIHDALLLPRGKPATWRRFRCGSPVLEETQQLHAQEPPPPLPIHPTTATLPTPLPPH